MKIVSRFPYLWPHLGFSLVEGVNEIEDNKIPLAAHAKLLHLSKPGVPVPTRNEEGKIVLVPTPAPISGYEPSKALADATDRNFPRQSKVKPPVATLETLQSQPAQPAPEPTKDSEQAKRGEQRR